MLLFAIFDFRFAIYVGTGTIVIYGKACQTNTLD